MNKQNKPKEPTDPDDGMVITREEGGLGEVQEIKGNQRHGNIKSCEDTI